LALGEVDVDGMLASMSSRLLSEWMVFAQLEPFGEERADLRAGIVASTIANANRDPKQQSKAFTAREFMPQFDQVETEDEPPDWERMLHMVELWNTALGGQDLRQ
jgi:hypothetical protein